MGVYFTFYILHFFFFCFLFLLVHTLAQLDFLLHLQSIPSRILCFKWFFFSEQYIWGPIVYPTFPFFLLLFFFFTSQRCCCCCFFLFFPHSTLVLFKDKLPYWGGTNVINAFLLHALIDWYVWSFWLRFKEKAGDEYSFPLEISLVSETWERLTPILDLVLFLFLVVSYLYFFFSLSMGYLL